ncbi:MAG: AraC family transcriptional regulator [Oculatellaceae cyanobacterium Prado106]|jgi:AraC-like DNA-binding protein|nr:AraC family transcriptional regulator [Oculatellaceae cyanobacterium Prado106]
MTSDLDPRDKLDLDVAVWEYPPGRPSDNLQSLACSYGGYREKVGRSVRRLEVSRDRVMVILGVGDRFQINALEPKASSIACQAFVVGLGEAPLLVEHDGFQHCIEIELLPGAAHQLFRGASAELAQGVVDLGQVWGETNLLLEQLSQMASWQQGFSLVDQFLLEKFAQSNQKVRSEIQWAWNQLDYSGGCIPIQQLAKTLGWSDRHFTNQFHEQIGITPKTAARRIRFTRSHQLLTGSNLALSEIAAACGYSDQSHFTREFHSFAGCSPTLYRKAHFPDLPGTPGDIIC